LRGFAFPAISFGVGSKPESLNRQLQKDMDAGELRDGKQHDSRAQSWTDFGLLLGSLVYAPTAFLLCVFR